MEQRNANVSPQSGDAAMISGGADAVATKVCGNCKTVMTAANEFCPKCGKKYVPLVCDKCHRVAATPEKFCHFCGKRVKSQKEKKKKIVWFVILGIVVLFFAVGMIVDVILENGDVADVAAKIDAIGEDYSALYKGDFEGERALKTKIDDAWRAYENLGAAWGSSAIEELEESGHLARLYAAKDELRLKEDLEKRIKALGEDLGQRVTRDAKATLKTPSSYQENFLSVDTIYEYNGKLYGGAYVSYSGTNSFGGRVDSSLHIYYVFDGKFEDISARGEVITETVMWKITLVTEYEKAKENGTDIHNIRLEA